MRSGGAEAAAVDEDVAGSGWKDGAGLPFSVSSRFQGAPMRNQSRGRLGRERVAEDAAYFEGCSARSRGTSAARGARRVARHRRHGASLPGGIAAERSSYPD